MTNTVSHTHLRQLADYAFEIDFGADLPRLQADEPPPLGGGAGPTPVQLLASAVGNCLSASLLFALRKLEQQAEPVGCHITAETGRNAEGRLRVLSMHATLSLGVSADALQHLDRVLGSFEGYCTVTQSVKVSIPVEVSVVDATGLKLK